MTIGQEIEVKPNDLFGIPELGIYFWLISTMKEREGESNTSIALISEGSEYFRPVDQVVFSLRIPSQNYITNDSNNSPIHLSANLLYIQNGELRVLPPHQVPNNILFLDHDYQGYRVINHKLTLVEDW